MRADWLDLAWSPRQHDYRRFTARLWRAGLLWGAVLALALWLGLT